MPGQTSKPTTIARVRAEDIATLIFSGTVRLDSYNIMLSLEEGEGLRSASFVLDGVAQMLMRGE